MQIQCQNLQSYIAALQTRTNELNLDIKNLQSEVKDLKSKADDLKLQNQSLIHANYHLGVLINLLTLGQESLPVPAEYQRLSELWLTVMSPTEAAPIREHYNLYYSPPPVPNAFLSQPINGVVSEPPVNLTDGAVISSQSNIGADALSQPVSVPDQISEPQARQGKGRRKRKYKPRRKSKGNNDDKSQISNDEIMPIVPGLVFKFQLRNKRKSQSSTSETSNDEDSASDNGFTSKLDFHDETEVSEATAYLKKVLKISSDKDGRRPHNSKIDKEGQRPHRIGGNSKTKSEKYQKSISEKQRTASLTSLRREKISNVKVDELDESNAVQSSLTV